MSDVRASRREAKGDAARLLHAAARERIAFALADLFIPETLGLSEQHRSTMAALLARLVRAVEDELRSSLARTFDVARYPALHAALTSTRVELAVPILASSEALRDPDLIALLLRRVEEHRLFRAAQAAGQAAGEGLLVELVRDRNREIARAAMAFLVAQSRRLDRFQEPVIVSPELPAEIEHRLVWTVAAALRVYLITRQNVDPAEADRALDEAAQEHLARYDEGEGLEARSMQLARALDGRGRLNDAIIARALNEGYLLFLHAALAVRCSLTLEATWEVLSDPRGNGPSFLLRAAAIGRAEAGPILLALAGTGPGVGTEDLLTRQLELFDGLTEDEARDAISLWRVDAAYRAAISRVSARRGRTVNR